MSVLSDLSPNRVFYYFEEIASMPHGSGNTSAVADYLENFAKEHALSFYKDDYGNVVIKADGTNGYEALSPVILQGHMDMVCVKTDSSSHDFKKDGLALVVDGDELYAQGTSLGGDDGIAVAYMLALLESDTIPHPPLECVFTSDEEIGMLGANSFDTSILSGRTLINLDSEEEGVLTCGCAGGARIDLILPIKRATVRGIPIVVKIDGLLGGHSGMMIHSGRASANKLMGRFLYELQDVASYSLEAVSGGDKDNAIAVLAKAHLIADPEEVPLIETFAADFQKSVLEELQGVDEGVCISVVKGEEKSVAVMDLSSQDKAVFLLLHAPHGLRKMNGLLPNTIETSSNVGIVRTTVNEFVVSDLVRSSVSSSKKALIAELRSLADFTGARFALSGDYPEWAYKKDSPLQKVMKEVYQRLYGKEPALVVTHGGLECGIFSKRIEGLDAVSMGPNMKDIHTSSERLSISSSASVWEYLLTILAELK